MVIDKGTGVPILAINSEIKNQKFYSLDEKGILSKYYWENGEVFVTDF